MKKRIILITAAVLLESFLLCGCGGTGTAAAPEEGTVAASEEQTDTGSGAETAQTGADTETGAERAAYEDFYGIVSDADPKKWDGFSLIDLDGDGIYELFATCIEGEREDEGIQPYMIAAYNNNKSTVNDALQDGVAGAGGYRGTLYYIEGRGILHESMTYAPFGIPADTVYVLKDGAVEISDTGEFSLDSYDDTEGDNWDPFEHGSWSWNGENVTEEEYYEALKKATGDSEGLPLCEIDWKSRDTMLEELKSLSSGSR